MLNDIRIYNYNDNEPLITRMEQAKKYFDDKFANIHADVDLTEVENKIDTVNTNIVNGNEEIKGVVSVSKEEIIEAIESSKPCLCNLATKKDICEAKSAIINKIDEDKDLIIQHVDEKFVDLNELIK